MKQQVPEPTPPLGSSCNLTDSAAKTLARLNIGVQYDPVSNSCVANAVTTAGTTNLIHVGPAHWIAGVLSQQGHFISMDLSCSNISGNAAYVMALADNYYGYTSTWHKIGGTTAAGTYTITDTCTDQGSIGIS